MKVGDYVRTKSGIIGKIESKNYIGYSDWLIDTLYYNDDEIIDDWTCGVKEYNILKSSPNIIDLIEVGDVLSFEDGSICRIVEISDNGYYLLKDFGGEQYYERKEYIDVLISIVTKEQFEQMSYKVSD